MRYKVLAVAVPLIFLVIGMILFLLEYTVAAMILCLAGAGFLFINVLAATIKPN